MLTAGAIVLGFTPIAPTMLWSPIAFAIMVGLLVGTVLTRVFQARVCFAWPGWREAAP
jgi:multidrug efflux pump subunit AcrB